MGILDGKDGGSPGRVRFRETEMLSASTLYPSLGHSRDDEGKITLVSLNVVLVCNLDHEFGESCSTLSCTVCLS